MTDGQWLLIILGLIYLSECVVWLPKDAIAVVHPLRGKPIVRAAAPWAGNDRGGLAFTTLIPARAVFVCNGSRFDVDDIRRRTTSSLFETRRLRVLAIALFALTFFAAPALSWRLGFAQIGLWILGAFAVFNATVAIAFLRTSHGDGWYRWSHAIVMLIATPSAIRAVDYATRNALRDFDPLAAATAVLGPDHPVVTKMLRELAYPPGGAERSARYEAARRAGLEHVERAPAGAARYCPRCLAAYEQGPAECADCGVELKRSA